MNKVGRYIAIVFLLVVFPTCSLFAPRSKPIELPVKSENLNLAWDAPAYAGTFPGTELSSYRIYYRTYGQTSWTLLDEIEADASPSLKITPSDLDYGYYEFAVSAVDDSDNESPLHTSTDTTADPITGWYVNWIGSG